MSRTVLSGAKMILFLLAGCAIYGGDAEPLPPLPSDNRPGDEYDSVHHRLLRADCRAHTLTALDLSTGEIDTLVDTWPWRDSRTDTCVMDAVMLSDGRRAFAVTKSGFRDASGSESCWAMDAVSIDTATGRVEELFNIHRNCCDDCGGYQRFDAPQADVAHQRLLFAENDCDANSCDSYLAGSDFGAMESTRIHPVFVTDCSPYPCEEACFDELESFRLQTIAFDPADPEHRVLLLLQDDSSRAAIIDSLDLDTGARQRIADVATVWGDLGIQWFVDLVVDVDQQRLFLTGLGTDYPWIHVVVAIDLVTGEQRLLYDGSTTGGLNVECDYEAAYDTTERRILLAADLDDESSCSGDVFALDPDTGALTLVSPGPGPSR